MPGVKGVQMFKRQPDLTAVATADMVEELMRRGDYLPQLILERIDLKRQVQQLAPLAAEVVEQRAEYRDVRRAFDTLWSNAVQDLTNPI
jgi:hypothetical protein